MKTIKYRLLNVFAEIPFGGNPLAVIEDGSSLTADEMQLVARQFNLSETTFLLPSSTAAARVRIFTPAYEMPFAGHPTLGSAQVVRELYEAGDNFGLEMLAGVIPVQAQGDRWQLKANAPTHRPAESTNAQLASALGLPESAIVGPALWVSCGNEQLMVPLGSVEQVRAAKPNAELMSRYAVNGDGRAKAYVFAATEEGFEVRFFWTPDGVGISEDPGTGSACANLGGWWKATRPNEPLDGQLSQGIAVGRPNLLSLKVDEAGEIFVGGRVVEIGRGELRW
jgi:PhzF family phenazine biosynthesis protein